MSTELAELLKLGRAERLQLVEDLWDSIAAEEQGLPLSGERIEELRRRKRGLEENPASGATWEQVKASARAQRQ